MSQLMVAQTAGTLFDIWLEVKDRVTEFLMACARQIGQPMDDGAPLAQSQFRQSLYLQRLVKSLIATDEAAIE